MSKTEPIDIVATASGLNHVTVAKTVYAFIAGIPKTVAKGHGITLICFGSLPTRRAQRS